MVRENKVRFSYTQKSSEDGFPGNLNVTVTYELLENSVMIFFDAISDADTILNITNHNYYNLSGNYKANILNHNLCVPAKEFVKTDENLIPIKIAELPYEMDFSEPTKVGNKLALGCSEFSSGGIDHCYIVSGVVCLEELESGRKLKVSSSNPAMQIYTCNFLEKNALSNGDVQQKFDAICFEPQLVGSFDGMYDNHPMKLKKGEKYNHFIKLEF